LETTDSASLRDYLAVLRRRKWIVLQAVVLVPLAAVLVSLSEQPLYQGTSEVLLNNRSLSATLLGQQDPTASQQPERIAQTQADLARVPEVARRALARVGFTDRTPQDLLDASSVAAKTDADLLEFKVTDPVRAASTALATAYANAFVQYRNQLDTGALKRADAEVTARLAELEAEGRAKSSLYASLVDKQQQLRTMEALQSSNASVVRPADEAVQVQPKTVRNGVLGLVLGMIVGVGLAFLVEALDTRVRSSDEVAERLGLPLLARLPAPPKRLRKDDRLVMLEEPTGPHAEPFRMLRMGLEFTTHDRGERVLLVASAQQSEGKSTTAANLAVAIAGTGRRVVLVDLDLRRPLLERMFGLEGRRGLTNVALGHLPLDEALVPIAVSTELPAQAPAPAPAPKVRSSRERPDPIEELLAIRHEPVATAPAPNGSNGNGASLVTGLLEVLPTGPMPPNAGELVASRAVGKILSSLRERADIVLVDSPPMLTVGDALTISQYVDGILLVARLHSLRRPTLIELRRVLDASRARPLGFVETDAALGGRYAYGYGYGEKRRSKGKHAPAGAEELI
jgi:succinoglycan biosynthesis transport protein ExoP